MTPISSIKPNVTREEALKCFRTAGISGLLRNLRYGRLQSVADIYLPFRLFRVTIENRSILEERILGVDAVQGDFDLYSFHSVPDSQSMVSMRTRNHPAVLIDENSARQIVLEKTRRLVYSQGLFRIKNLCIGAELIPLDIHIPYWVGFSGPSNNLNLTVMDAVRRRFEGAKIRAFVREWLTASSHPQLH
jgi:hypothetical protein